MQDAIEHYLNGLTVTQGIRTGAPFEVLPWQSKFIERAFAEGVQEAGLTMARGGGKTTLMAGIALAFLEAEGVAQRASEVTCVAASAEQGRLLFDHALRFIDGRRRDYKVRDQSRLMQIQHKKLGTVLRVVGANPSSLHGAAPSLVLADEVAQWPRNKKARMLAALRTGLGKIPNSRLVAIGTRADTPSDTFELLLQQADYSQIHAARPSDKPFQIASWRRACPSLESDFPDLLAAYRKDAKRAKGSPEFMAAFEALRLNRGVPDALGNVLITLATWRRCEGEAPRKGPVFWGIDLGGSAAASAVAAYWPETGRLESLAAFGSVPDLYKRGEQDGVGRLYVRAHEAGELLVLGQRAVPYRELIEAALGRLGRPEIIACDRWRLAELQDALEVVGLFPAIHSRGQGYKDGAEDVRQFRRAIAEGKVTVPRQIFLSQCMGEARVISDPAGNQKLAKSSEGGRRARARDDSAAAAILAVAVGYRSGRQAPQVIYHGRLNA